MRFLGGHLWVGHSRWPWQTQRDYLDSTMGRFGGGWKVKLGVDISWHKGDWHINLNLLFGVITILWESTVTRRLREIPQKQRVDNPPTSSIADWL